MLIFQGAFHVPKHFLFFLEPNTAPIWPVIEAHHECVLEYTSVNEAVTLHCQLDVTYHSVDNVICNHYKQAQVVFGKSGTCSSHRTLVQCECQLWPLSRVFIQR